MGKRASSTENGMHLFVFGSSFTSWDGAHSWAKTAHKPRDVRRERKMKSTGASAPQPKLPKINGFYLRWSRAENNLHRFVHRYSVNVRALRLCAICWVCVCVLLLPCAYTVRFCTDFWSMRIGASPYWFQYTPLSAKKLALCNSDKYSR